MTTQTSSDKGMALPPIRQAIPELLEAVPANRGGTRAYDSFSNTPQARPSSQTNSYSLNTSTIPHSSSHERNTPHPPWDLDTRDSRHGQTSHSSNSISSYHTRSSSSGANASNEYHGTYHLESSPRPAIAASELGDGTQPTNLPHHESTSTDDSSGLAHRPNMISTESSESRTPSEPISPDFAGPPYYDEQEGGQQSNFQGQPKASGDYSYPVRPLHIISDFESQKNKRRRGNLPKHVTDLLRRWYSEHRLHPYPTEDEKQQLMSDTGLSIAQISNWFINARRRTKLSPLKSSKPLL